MYSKAINVTPIDMLPELEDLEINESMMTPSHPSNMRGVPYGNPAIQGGSSYATNSTYPGAPMLPSNEVERVGRYIRGGHAPPQEAGMMTNTIPSNMHNMHNIQPVPSTEYYAVPVESDNSKQAPPIFNAQAGKPSDSVGGGCPSCLEFADHVQACPLCSKFYNNDKTIYIIAIVILAIVCILLLKRVLETS